jgi:hypothetical protein
VVLAKSSDTGCEVRTSGQLSAVGTLQQDIQSKSLNPNIEFFHLKNLHINARF